MTCPRLSLVLAAVTLTVALALAADGLAAEWLGLGSPAVRWLLLSASIGLLATLAFAWLVRGRLLGSEALAELDLLSRLDNRRLALGAAEPNISELRPGTTWAKTIRRLRDRLGLLARRVDELERERAIFEGRARRYEAQNQRINSILSALGEPVLVIDKRDDLVLTNSSAERLFNIDTQHVEERALAALVDCQRLVELLTDTRKCRVFTERSCELEIPTSAGVPAWYRVTARNIPTLPGQSDPDNTSQGVVAVLHDISAQKTIQKKNAEFVSAVSHEMRTPLAGIKAYLELLADGDADDAESERQFLGVIGTEADRLQCLVDDLVELARIEADLAGTARRIEPLKAVLEEALVVAAADARAKNVALHSELAAEPLCVTIDRHLIAQAAGQLISNAIKYTPAGGRVIVRSRAAGNQVAFEVEDTGVGLAPEDCRKVFEKFYRVPRAKDMAAGAGLGLPLVKHIVEDVHGGRVEVASTLGAGSRFTVLLPAADAARPETATALPPHVS